MASPLIILSFDPETIAATAAALDGFGRDFKRVITGTINDALRKVQRESVDRVYRKLAVTKREIRKRTKTISANFSNLTGQFTFVKGARIPLKRFHPRQVGGSGQFGSRRRIRLDEQALKRDTAKLIRGQFRGGPNPAAGVTYRIERGGKRKLATQAFIVESLGSHVWKRVDKGRLPIRKLRGPSPWGVFVHYGMDKEVIEVGKEEMDDLLEKRLDFVIKQRRGEIPGRRRKAAP